MEKPTAVDIWALSDLATPWCMHVVVTLGVANKLEAGATGIAQLANAVGADQDALHRILRQLVSRGVFEESAPGHFQLNEAARSLLEPGVVLGFNLDGFGGRMAYAWSSLLNAVRTGQSAYHEVFGLPFWEDLEANPEIASQFDDLMGPPGHGRPDPAVLVNDDWQSVHTVIDVGGGTGALLAEVLKAHPDVRGILVDLPQTVGRSTSLFREAGVLDRVTTVGQSFFDPLPVGGDIYMLKSVLADWADAEAVQILRRCAEAARPTGRIVILNGVSPDSEGGPSPALLMLVLVGGRERQLKEFSELARTAGLEVTATARQDSGRFVVECRPI